MTAISEKQLQPGSFKYGRSMFIVWDVVPVEGGYEYQDIEVPKDADEGIIIDALRQENLGENEIVKIMACHANNAVVEEL